MYDMPTMPEVEGPPTFILHFIWIAAALVFFIYRFQVGSSILDSLFRKRRSNEEKELEARINNYLDMNRDHISDEKENTVERIVASSPKLHLLNAVKNNEEIILYISNEGGLIFNLEIKSRDFPKIEIEPHEKLSNEESGYIKIENDAQIDSAIKFELNYLDPTGRKNTKKYMCLISDMCLKEI